MARPENNAENLKILIISEDSESFPSYLGRILTDKFLFQSNRKKSKNSFKKTTYNPLKQINIEIEIDNYAPRMIKTAKERSKEYHKIYCVFDYSKIKKNDYIMAMNFKVPDNVIKINSVLSYEIWLLLHFSNSSEPFLTDKHLIKKLEECVRQEIKNFKYSKSKISDQFYKILESRTEQAVKNAKKIEKENSKTGNNQSSATKIYKLIEDLENFSK